MYSFRVRPVGGKKGHNAASKDKAIDHCEQRLFILRPSQFTSTGGCQVNCLLCELAARSPPAKVNQQWRAHTSSALIYLGAAESDGASAGHLSLLIPSSRVIGFLGISQAVAPLVCEGRWSDRLKLTGLRRVLEYNTSARDDIIIFIKMY